MDNLSTQKAARIEATIIACGCTLRFSTHLQFYRADLSKLRTCGSRHSERHLDALADRSLAHITTGRCVRLIKPGKLIFACSTSLKVALG